MSGGDGIGGGDLLLDFLEQRAGISKASNAGTEPAARLYDKDLGKLVHLESLDESRV